MISLHAWEDFDQPRARLDTEIGIDLPSLEPMIEAYSRKVWYTIGPRGGVPRRGPKPPLALGYSAHLAAHVIDTLASQATSFTCHCETPVAGLARFFPDITSVEAVYQIAGLTSAETRVARLRHEGLSGKETAMVIGRAEGTVWALSARAAAKLRALGERTKT